MKLAKDLTGQKFGRWIALERSSSVVRWKHNKKSSTTYWKCRCVCGFETRVSYSNLMTGVKKNRGCKRCSLKDVRKNAKRADWVSKDGYVMTRNYPNPHKTKSGIVPRSVHRVVMEHMLGRELLPTETVHHINGIRTDNRPANLELWSTRHPRGQRIPDILDFAFDMIKNYADAETIESWVATLPQNTTRRHQRSQAQRTGVSE